MRENLRLAFVVSLVVLAGFPLFFLVLSLYTGSWNFFMYSLAPSLAAGLTGLLLVKQKLKKAK
ncbi:hypothetical protein [Domibacillus indicus]|uniref:hypothetical protein n=1 Tax=Domibacillus indicus TaxID=1437523 RepID=UPI0006181868|nr:hypothetical protein [Domibacillus indicus]